MGQVADHAQQPVVGIGMHDLDIGAHLAPQLGDFFQCFFIGLFGRRQHTAMAHKQILPRRLGAPLLAAGDRMAGDKRNMLGQDLLHAANDFAFDTADIADDTTLLQLGQKRLVSGTMVSTGVPIMRRSTPAGKSVADKITVDKPLLLGDFQIAFAAAVTDDFLDQFAPARIEGQRTRSAQLPPTPFFQTSLPLELQAGERRTPGRKIKIFRKLYDHDPFA